jgi:hypothetical protein
MVGIFVACMSVAAPLSVANGNFQRQPGFYLALTLAFTAFMVVGAVIVAHRPSNAIGWLFSAIGLLTATGTLAVDYAEYAYVTRPGSLPASSSSGSPTPRRWRSCSRRCRLPSRQARSAMCYLGSLSPSSRPQPASRSCAIGCTTSTG